MKPTYAQPIPEGVSLEALSDMIVISMTWYKPFMWVRLPVLIFGDGCMLLWIFDILYIHTFLLLYSLPLPVLMLVIFVRSTYYTFCTFVNTTKIILTNEGFEIKIGPCWWPGELQVYRRDLKGFFVIYNLQHRGRMYSVAVVSSEGHEKILFSRVVMGEKKSYEKTLEQQQVEYVCGYLNNYYDTIARFEPRFIAYRP